MVMINSALALAKCLAHSKALVIEIIIIIIINVFYIRNKHNIRGARWREFPPCSHDVSPDLR